MDVLGKGHLWLYPPPGFLWKSHHPNEGTATTRCPLGKPPSCCGVTSIPAWSPGLESVSLVVPWSCYL